VLEAFDAPNNTAPPIATHFLLVDTSYANPSKQIDLAGQFEFDAVSNDGQRVYMIQYLSSDSYHVRMFNVATGHLDPTIVFDKTDGNTAMAGLKVSGVASRDGHWLYSLYIRKNLALSADGSHLYATNGAMGLIADLDSSNGAPNLTRTVRIAAPRQTASLIQGVEAKGFGANGAVVTPDGRTLVTSGATGVIWIDTDTLHVTGRQLTSWTVWSLALSPNGDELYAVNDTGMIAEVSMAGTHAASTFAGGPGQPMALIRVQAAQAP
jgi:hypothetical protein